MKEGRSFAVGTTAYKHLSASFSPKDLENLHQEIQKEQQKRMFTKLKSSESMVGDLLRAPSPSIPKMMPQSQSEADLRPKAPSSPLSPKRKKGKERSKSERRRMEKEEFNRTWRRTKVMFEPGEEGKTLVLAGPLSDLISFSLFSGDNAFVDSFLYAHLSFIASGELLSAIIRRLRALPKDPPEHFHNQLKSGLSMVNRWISLLVGDFESREMQSLLAELLEFIRAVVPYLPIQTDVDGQEKLLTVEDLLVTLQHSRLLCSWAPNMMYNPDTLAQALAGTLHNDLLSFGWAIQVKKKALTFTAMQGVEVLSKRLAVERDTVTKAMKLLVERKMLKLVTGAGSNQNPKDKDAEPTFEDNTDIWKLFYKRNNASEKDEKNTSTNIADNSNNSYSSDIGGSPFSSSSSITTKRTSLLSFTAVDIAKQLSLEEFELFRKIQRKEFVQKAWSDESRGKELAPNLLHMIDNFNHISFWVATEMVTQPDLKQRIELLRRFVAIAECCRQMNNYSTMMQIVVGLSLSPVSRLEKTWKALSPKVENTFKILTVMTSGDNNYKLYRTQLHQNTDPPAIPALGVYLKDLTFIEDGNDTYLSKKKEGEGEEGATNPTDQPDRGLLNFAKMRMIASVIQEVHRFQQCPYEWEENVAVKDYIKACKVLTTDKELRALSLSCEPSQRHSMPAMDPKTLSEYIAAQEKQGM
ncbi:Ras guanine nucleotide exchange factor [Balamuthia mandrillaris]